MIITQNESIQLKILHIKKNSIRDCNIHYSIKRKEKKKFFK